MTEARQLVLYDFGGWILSFLRKGFNLFKMNPFRRGKKDRRGFAGCSRSESANNIMSAVRWADEHLPKTMSVEESRAKFDKYVEGLKK